jgi:hypothetical protein
MINAFDRRYFLLIGIALLLLVVASTLTGETLNVDRYRPGIVDRSVEPKRFWWNVVVYFLGGLFFIGLYLYEISN